MELILRPLEASDERALRRMHAELAEEGFELLLHDGPWDDVLKQAATEAAGVGLPKGRVPADFLVAVVEETLVGRVSIRHQLNDFLLREGGHVGYAVAPAHRRRGYATEILRQSVGRLAALGVERVLVTCDDDNVASARTIERCGGVLENVVQPGSGPVKRRYWIDAHAAG